MAVQSMMLFVFSFDFILVSKYVKVFSGFYLVFFLSFWILDLLYFVIGF